MEATGRPGLTGTGRVDSSGTRSAWPEQAGEWPAMVDAGTRAPLCTPFAKGKGHPLFREPTMSTFNPESSPAQESPSTSTAIPWGAVAAAGGMLLWKAARPSLGTLLKAAALTAGGVYAYRRYATPKDADSETGATRGASDDAQASSKPPVLSLDEARDAAQKLASAWGAHLSGAAETPDAAQKEADTVK